MYHQGFPGIVQIMPKPGWESQARWPGIQLPLHWRHLANQFPVDHFNTRTLIAPGKAHSLRGNYSL